MPNLSVCVQAMNGSKVLVSSSVMHLWHDVPTVGFVCISD